MTSENEFDRYIPLAQWADENGISGDRARNAARRGLLGAIFVQSFKRWVVDVNDPPNPDDITTGTRRTTRDDGRRLYHVYVNADEHAALVGTLDNGLVIDPRVRDRERRAARKAAKATDTTNGVE